MAQFDDIFGAAMRADAGGGGASTGMPPSAPSSPFPPAPPMAVAVVGATDVSDGGKAGDNANPALPNTTEAVQSTPMSALASYVMARFQENESFRRTSGIDERLDYCLRSQKQMFSERQMDVLSQKVGPDVARRIFVPITSVKIRAARAMLIDLANQSGEPLFRIEPTPMPDVEADSARKAATEVAANVERFFGEIARNGIQEVPPEVMAKLGEYVETAARERYDVVANADESFARIRAERMQKKVWDLMEEGGWSAAFTEYLDYICTYGTGVIVGPVMRNVAKNQCRRMPNGVLKYSRVVKSIPTYEAVNPCDCYPAPDAKDVDDGPFCIRVKYVADELARYAQDTDGSELGNGWIAPQVNTLLARHPRGGVRLSIGFFSTERRFCENNGFEDVADCTFEGIRCFATVRGSELLSIGVTKTNDASARRIEPSAFYRTETVVIDNRVVYCRIYSSTEELPVSKGVFYTLPGSWWGDSIAEKVAMCQCVLNNCISSLMANMPASSGAIFWVNDVQRIANKSPTALKLRAGMTIPFTASAMGSQGAPIGSISVPSNAGELLNVFKQMQTQADLDSGLPAYTEGQSGGQSGALRTASGLAIFTEASTRGLKMVMTTTDQQVISKVARLTADWVLLHDDDVELKGDVEIRPVGLLGKILKAQRDQQRFQMFQLVLNSQLLQQSIGIKGVLELFRPSLRDIDVNPDDILPSKAKMAEMELVQEIEQVFRATSAAQGVQANAAGPQGAPQGETPEGAETVGEMPEAEPAEPAPGSVAERRSVA